jgi:hypothetical protein
MDLIKNLTTAAYKHNNAILLFTFAILVLLDIAVHLYLTNGKINLASFLLNNIYLSEVIQTNSSNTTLTLNQSNFTSTARTTASHEKKCNPLTSLKQYTVKIDGLTYPQYLPSYFNVSLNFNCLNKSRAMKKIMLWNGFFGHDDFYFGLGKVNPFVKNKCPVTNCEIFNDKRLLNEADLVVVHMRDHIPDIPEERSLLQRWVFFLLESPIYGKLNTTISNRNDLFNMTATYRLDSDFEGLYEDNAGFVWAENKTFDLDTDFGAGKDRLGVAVISFCNVHSERQDYIRAMQSYAVFDVYGRCGSPCPVKKRNGQPGECKEILAERYKFYLAFENSYCVDYITEKFFYILRFNIVPVVFGGGNYSVFVPKSGYINALDYKSPKLLVEYLKYLDKNQTAYNAYFKWKRHITFHRRLSGMCALCGMCIRLHMEDHFGVKRQVLGNLSSVHWNRDRQCRKPQYKRGEFFRF